MEGIKDFSCSFQEEDTSWYLRIVKDGITIQNPYAPINLTLNYEKYPEFTMIDATYHAGGVEVEGHFKSDKFEMTVYYKDYYKYDSDEITHQDGNILVNNESMNFSFPVPYSLAKGLIKLGQGITEIDDAKNVKA